MNEQKINKQLEDIVEKIYDIEDRIILLEKKINDSNNILHTQKTERQIKIIFFIIHWIFVIGAGIVAWSYIKPIYIKTLKTYQKIEENYNKLIQTNENIREKIKKITDDKTINNIIDKTKKIIK